MQTPNGGWEKKAVHWSRLLQIVAVIAVMYGVKAIISPLMDAWLH